MYELIFQALIDIRFLKSFSFMNIYKIVHCSILLCIPEN